MSNLQQPEKAMKSSGAVGHDKIERISVILRCDIPVVCLNHKAKVNSVKNTTMNIWLNDGVY